MGGKDNLKAALEIYSRLRAQAAGGQVNAPCDDRDIELALAKHLQFMGGNTRAALEIYTRLRANGTEGLDNVILGLRALQPQRAPYDLGTHSSPGPSSAGNHELHQLPHHHPRHDLEGSYRPPVYGIDESFRLLKVNPQRALTEAEALLTKYSGNPFHYARVVQLKARALCHLSNFDECVEYVNSLPPELQNDKRVIMAKAKALQAKGHLTEALPLFQSLYEKYSVLISDKKANGLALCRHLQLMGGKDNLRAALNTCTQLRTQAAGGREMTPCDDIEIELALGKILQSIGKPDSLRTALDIYTWLRTKMARGQNTPSCQAKEIELAIATTLIDMGEWRQFDELQLDTQPFSEFETCLCISRRNLQELMTTENSMPERSALLGKALHWAALAVEKTESTNAPCLRQLSHCYHLLSTWPQSGLQLLGIKEKKEHEFRQLSALLFAKANELAPH
ncbi:tetratricopeptide repeat protein [Sansalvadorimonas verongulae]|nr:tetratricopeptide repeat protein [Sansalvadorimonas verongulae]